MVLPSFIASFERRGDMDKILLAALGLAATIIKEVCDPED